MVIDFNNIAEESLMNFRGGEGILLTRNYVDADNKIMFSKLTSGASSGYHAHEGNCEIVCILKGTARFTFDGKDEICHAGQVHYCPNGHSHSMHNDTDEPIEYLAIVTNLNKEA